MRRAVFVALIALIGCGKSSVDRGPPIVWHNLAEGEAIAKREHRPLVIAFDATWDGASREFERYTWSDPDVRDAMRDYVPVVVDCTDDEDREEQRIVTRFKVVGLPTVILYDEEQGELARVTEFIKAPKMYSLLRNAKPH